MDPLELWQLWCFCFDAREIRAFGDGEAASLMTYRLALSSKSCLEDLILRLEDAATAVLKGLDGQNLSQGATFLWPCSKVFVTLSTSVLKLRLLPVTMLERLATASHTILMANLYWTKLRSSPKKGEPTEQLKECFKSVVDLCKMLQYCSPAVLNPDRYIWVLGNIPPHPDRPDGPPLRAGITQKMFVEDLVDFILVNYRDYAWAGIKLSVALGLTPTSKLSRSGLFNKQLRHALALPSVAERLAEEELVAGSKVLHVVLDVCLGCGMHRKGDLAGSRFKVCKSCTCAM